MNIEKMLRNAMILHQRKNLPEAEKLYRSILAKKPHHPEANFNLGFLAMQTNRPEVALPLLTRALRANPRNPQLQQALATAKAAVARKAQAATKTAAPSQGGLHQQLQALVSRQRYEAALKLAEEATEQAPDDSYAWKAAGTIACLMGKPENALPYLQKALTLTPEDAETQNALGNAFKDMGRLEEAEAAYREAMRLKPDYTDPHENLFDLLEKSNQLDKLDSALQSASRSITALPATMLWKAYVLNGRKEYAEAYQLLKDVPVAKLETPVKAKYHKLLADLAQRLEHYDEAFSSYQEANRIIMRLPENSPCDKTRFTRQIDTLFQYFTPERVASWQACKEPQGVTPVFLIGFPRSGTTLLDTILRSHPRVTVVEEKPMVDKVVGALAERSINLVEMDDRQCEQLRDIYYEELGKHVDHRDARHVIIDKMPLNIIYVGIIKKLFPSARFVLSLRHPCDSVLSCFMQTFEMNDAMANFSTLEDSAALYSKVMQLWERYDSLLDLDVFTIKYEDIISDFEQAITPLLTFLDLPWDDAMTNYRETALKRGNINTPSYNQVTQPLYRSAMDRWKRYESQLAASLPMLTPWCDRFGYSKE